jgi:hypothetical protein
MRTMTTIDRALVVLYGAGLLLGFRQPEFPIWLLAIGLLLYGVWTQQRWAFLWIAGLCTLASLLYLAGIFQPHVSRYFTRYLLATGSYVAQAAYFWYRLRSPELAPSAATDEDEERPRPIGF